MASNVRFADQLSVSAFGNIGGVNAVSSSYAETASFADYATSASYAVSASHEITKEVSSSYADTASFAQSGNGIFSGSFSGSFEGNIPSSTSSSYAATASFAQSGNGIFSGSFSGSFEGNGSGLTNIPASGITGLNLSQISSGSATASISPNGGLYVNTNITSSGNILAVSMSGDGSQLTNIVSSSYSTTSSYAFNAISSSYALTASYAVSASHEIIHELSSSYAETASFAQSGDGIFRGSFSGSFEGNGSGLTDIPATGIVGLNLSQIASGSSTASISPNGGLFVNTNITASGNISASGFISASYFVGDGSQLINVVSSSYALTSSYVETAQTASYVLSAISSSYALTASYAVSASHEIIKEVSSSYADTASFAQSGNGIFSGSFSGSFEGIANTASYALTASYVEISQTASYVETAQTASYVLNAVSSSFSSFAISASYAVSASHEIIKEVSSSYADTASFAQSGNGIFSGSFSGSYVGDGSGLTGVDPFPFSGSAVITGSLLVSGSSLPLEIIGSGSTIFSVQGSLGELFAIDDVNSGSLLTINDSGGDSQFEVFSDGKILIGGEPRSLYTTATINATLAATSESIYSLSTSSYDGVFFDYTVSSASNARAGNIMSIWNGGNLVYTENTTTDIGSTVGVTFNVEISQSQAQLISITDTAGWKIKTTVRSI